MELFSNKVKIFYLLIVIFFCLGSFLYLLYSWGILNLADYIPGLNKEAPLVAQDHDAPDDLEWERLKKEQERISEQRLNLEKEFNELHKEKENLGSREEALQQKIDSLEKERNTFIEAQNSRKDYKQNIRDMASRLQSMPPQEVVDIVANWSNSDLLTVFLQMERNANEQGNQSIVPYLLTLMPRARAALLMSLMIDEKIEEPSDE